MKTATHCCTHAAIAFFLCIAASGADAPAWRFSAGPVYRNRVDVTVNGSSYVQTLGLHAADPYFKDPAGMGDKNKPDNRTYDDGFVHIDDFTLSDGLTWFWGWENAGQFDGRSQTLGFQRAGGVRVTRDTLLDEGMTGDEDVNGGGLAVMTSRAIASPFLEKISAILELCFGARGFWNEEARFTGTTYRERITKETHSFVDTYDVGYDLTATAAYPPPHEGDIFGPGPLIPNLPDNRERVVTSRATWEAENRIDMDVESDLYEFWIGPRISVQPGRKLSLYCIPNISANYLTMDIDRNEQFVAIYPGGQTETVESWHDSASEGEWLFGAGIQVGAEIDIRGGWFCGVFGGYDWTWDDAEVDVGPNTVTINPSGYTVGVEVGKKL